MMKSIYLLTKKPTNHTYAYLHCPQFFTGSNNHIPIQHGWEILDGNVMVHFVAEGSLLLGIYRVVWINNS